MKKTDQKPVNLTDVGRKLVSHSKSTEFSANRGLVVELFPFIFEASERMSARAISRYLMEKQNIKLSGVTITKALNDPKKSWVSFFGTIEPSATVIAKWHRPVSFKFLFEKKSIYEASTALATKNPIGRITVAFSNPERLSADRVLREKWFTIDLETRLKAKPYLEEHLRALEDKF
jgi:hypothetical protein